jgi:ABC-2 type transport system permease protein
MREFLALLRREWQEHRAVFLWGPGVVLCLILIAGFMAFLIDNNVSIEIGDTDRSEFLEKIGDGDVGGLEAITAMGLDAAGSTDAELEARLNGLLLALVQPFHSLLLIFIFFALVAALYDERKDHSVLFWKSMPVNDIHCVASKFAFVAWVAPICTIAAIFAAQIFAVTLASIYVEDGMGSRVWSASGVFLRPFDLVLAYLIHSLWAVPFYGWVLMISAWASKAPTMWAIGGPAVAMVLERIVLGTSQIADIIFGHAANMRLIHTQVSFGDSIRLPQMFDRFAGFGELSFWIGLVVGLGFLAGAVYLRRVKNEI